MMTVAQFIARGLLAVGLGCLPVGQQDRMAVMEMAGDVPSVGPAPSADLNLQIPPATINWDAILVMIRP